MAKPGPELVQGRKRLSHLLLRSGHPSGRYLSGPGSVTSPVQIETGQSRRPLSALPVPWFVQRPRAPCVLTCPGSVGPQLRPL